jgi:DNA-binding MarR family transcriptional regulator
MSRQKDNYTIGSVSGLTLSQKLILEALVGSESSNYVLHTWKIQIATKLSESSVVKALRMLKYRGLVSGKGGANRLPPKVLVKLKEESD